MYCKLHNIIKHKYFIFIFSLVIFLFTITFFSPTSINAQVPSAVCLGACPTPSTNPPVSSSPTPKSLSSTPQNPTPTSRQAAPPTQAQVTPAVAPGVTSNPANQGLMQML